jgi:N-acetylornithine carbamoyltransferase
MKHFLDLTSLDDPALQRLLARARDLKRHPVRESLRGRVLGLLFLNPSLRTLASFQAGMAQLGGSSFVITPGQGTWALETRPGAVMDGSAAEHVREAIPVLCQYADVLGIRCFAGGNDLAEDLREPVLKAVAAAATKPIINLESAADHPCQALADWKTLDDLKIPARGGRFVLSWAWHPKPLPLAVPRAAATMAARRGMDVIVLRPEGWALPREIMDEAHNLAGRSGGSVSETHDQAAALEGAHVLYAKSWQAPSFYGRPAEESVARAALRHWCVSEDWFAPARAEAVFLHCLPVRRNVVVKDEVLDGPRSRVVEQAQNRLHVQKAILCELLGVK